MSHSVLDHEKQNQQPCVHGPLQRLTTGRREQLLQLRWIPAEERVDVWEVDANIASGGAFQT